MGVKSYPVDESGRLDGLPYWGLRLLGVGSEVPTVTTAGEELLEEKYTTFLRVYGS